LCDKMALSPKNTLYYSTLPPISLAKSGLNSQVTTMAPVEVGVNQTLRGNLLGLNTNLQLSLLPLPTSDHGWLITQPTRSQVARLYLPLISCRQCYAPYDVRTHWQQYQPRQTVHSAAHR